jgi:two-component system, chemotaxis family, CheB/CheR fusion protein
MEHLDRSDLFWGRAALSPADETSISAIFDLIRDRTGHELSVYRLGPLLHAFDRRMAIERQTSLQGYLDHLSSNVEALQPLIRDLLVSVTSFFRDPPAWDHLGSHVIGPLVESASADSPIRIWIVACSTGEEAYSLAICLDEEFERLRKQRNYTIFASDCHSHVVEKARRAVYPKESVAHMGSTRLKRYFRERNGQYAIEQDIRYRIAFAEHNVLQHEPLAGMHLIVCRNMLMYMRKETQLRVTNLFHDALRGGGYLFLGDSERTGSPAFLSMDVHHPIYSAAGHSPWAIAPSGLACTGYQRFAREHDKRT